MIDARNYVARDSLRNGTPVTIRAVRSGDRDRVARAFGNLERDSVYTRFFTYKKALSDAELASIDAMDFVNDVMLIATVARDADEIVIGSARYIAQNAPDGNRAAEVAFTVEEDYQGKGLAGRLIGHLIGIARQLGIARFEADVLSGNKAMLAVFARSGLPMRQRREGGVVHITLALAGTL
ncbi:MAG TPA: GNAT family N-acetyltransferase [Casimicrobiaceae bacterium]|nr:GNAT family N-acetyltransferase [Casimicrobiaceae bacterium]